MEIETLQHGRRAGISEADIHETHLACDLSIPAQRIGTFDTELVEHFFQVRARAAR